MIAGLGRLGISRTHVPTDLKVTAAAVSFARSVVLSASLLGIASCATSPPSPPPIPAVPLPVPVTEPPPRPVEEAAEPVLPGTVISVIDGDTAKIQLSSGPINVRFDSIDAPEKDQPGGIDAQARLAQRIVGRQVYLEVKEQDRYERLVAVVYLDDLNVNAWLVQSGLAWAYRDYLRDPRFCDWEAQARVGRLGLWARSPYVAPWEWRASQRNPGTVRFTDFSGETAQACRASVHRGSPPATHSSVASGRPSVTPLGGCRIKDNISDNGRIYHVPGSASYDRTLIDEAKGERWFCTEAEARAAGWRAPR